MATQGSSSTMSRASIPCSSFREQQKSANHPGDPWPPSGIIGYYWQPSPGAHPVLLPGIPATADLSSLPPPPTMAHLRSMHTQPAGPFINGYNYPQSVDKAVSTQYGPPPRWMATTISASPRESFHKQNHQQHSPNHCDSDDSNTSKYSSFLPQQVYRKGESNLPKKKRPCIEDDANEDEKEGRSSVDVTRPQRTKNALKRKQKDTQETYDGYDGVRTKGKKRPRGRKSNFDDMFEQLLAFRSEHGHCNVPTSPKSALGTWVTTTRRSYRRYMNGEPNALTPERIAKLTEAGLELKTRIFVTFEERVEQCKEFIKEHGHLRIPRSHPMGAWAGEMRQQYKCNLEGKKTSLTPERLKVLDDMGFAWMLRTRATNPGKFRTRRSWEERVEEFKQFKEVHGHPFVPQHLSEPKGLGGWVAEVRLEYKHMMEGKPSIMTPLNALELNNLGFVWDVSSTIRMPESELIRMAESEVDNSESSSSDEDDYSDDDAYRDCRLDSRG